jgi:spermidine/putrescine-binding protein
MATGRILSIAMLAMTATWFCGCSHQEPPKGENTVRVLIWTDYVAPEVIQEFERRMNCKVVLDTFVSDAQLEDAVLKRREAYDVVFPSDRVMQLLVDKDVLEPLDTAQVPNISHLDGKFLYPQDDPKRRFAVPYHWGTIGVGVRTDLVQGAPTGFEALFDERNKGHVTMLDDAEHAFAIALIHLRHPPNSTNRSHLEEAKSLLLRQRPLILEYTSDRYKDELDDGSAWASLGWNGDLAQARAKNPKVKVLIPESGTIVWVDNIAVLKASGNRRLAHAFVNFLLDPEVAAKNATSLGYATPNKTAAERIPAAEKEDPVIYPPQTLLEKCELLRHHGPEDQLLEQLWQEVKGSKP